MSLQAEILPPPSVRKRPRGQTAIPCVMMRGGTSRGPFFLREDLPADDELMKRVLLRVMGSPHVRQIDGIG
jgi:4-oxalomesaconate tautomerase